MLYQLSHVRGPPPEIAAVATPPSGYPASRGGSPDGQHDSGAATPTATSRPSLRETWPLHRSDALLFLLMFAGLTAHLVRVGWLLTGPLEDSALVQADEDVSQWFADGRTPQLDDWATAERCSPTRSSRSSSPPSSPESCSPCGATWREPLMVAIPLILEASVFITVTWIVGRPRPDAPRLEESPVDSSFFQRTAAAAAYHAHPVVVVFWRSEHLEHGGSRRLVAVIPVTRLPGRFFCLPGMHYLTTARRRRAARPGQRVRRVAGAAPPPGASNDVSLTLVVLLP